MHLIRNVNDKVAAGSDPGARLEVAWFHSRGVLALVTLVAIFCDGISNFVQSFSARITQNENPMVLVCNIGIATRVNQYVVELSCKCRGYGSAPSPGIFRDEIP